MRHLIRLNNAAQYAYDDCDRLTKTIRAILDNSKVKTVNLRVSRKAVEFDLFSDTDEELQDALGKLKTVGRLLTVRGLDILPPPGRTKQEILEEARRLFNEERFWEVHEALEEIWKQEAGAERELLQGLILLAASYVHLQRGKHLRVIPILERALAKIEGSKLDSYHVFDLRLIKKKGRSFLKRRRLTPFQLSREGLLWWVL